MSEEVKLVKKTFEVEIELLSTYVVFVDAEDEEKARDMIFSGDYDTGSQESKERECEFRDLLSIKELDKDENYEGLNN